MSPQCQMILGALERGQTLTVAKAMKEFGVYALSQRCTELRRMGYPIQSYMIQVGDKHVAEYKLGELHDRLVLSSRS